MVKNDSLGASIKEWAKGRSSVRALVLIGSQVHADHQSVSSADEYSDWDFQVVAQHPADFEDPGWLAEIGLAKPLAYTMRLGRLGSATKVSAVLQNGELDLVLIPSRRLSLARLTLNLGVAKRIPSVYRKLGELALVLRAGYRMLKGEAAWGKFFQSVATDIPPPRLTDDDVRALAEGFVCDYVSTRNKIERGELIAAQRWIHQHLAETNFQLMHEHRQRCGEPSQPDARRVEMLGVDSRWISVAASPNRESLRAAVEKSATGMRELTRRLVGDTWRWPL